MLITDKAAKERVWEICQEVAGQKASLEEFRRDVIPWQDEYWYQTFDERIYEHENWYTLRSGEAWIGWSLPNVRGLAKVLGWWKPVFSGTFVDVGAGIGASTVQLLQLFPRCTAVYTNLPSQQVDVARRLFDEFGVADRVEVTTNGKPRSAEVVLALEMLEHVQDPVGFITPWLERARFFVDGSSFTAKACGHWPEFAGGIPAKDMRRVFNKALRTQGFQQTAKLGAPKLWNGRPGTWIRASADT